MAKLVEIYHEEKSEVYKRQLPLTVDEGLTMVMDLNSMGLICDSPLVRGKELDEFIRKCNILSQKELKEAFEVSSKDMMNILNQTVPCVGCRRSVERLFYKLTLSGHETLDPLVVTKDGVLTVAADLPTQVLCTLLHGHSTRLKLLVESQPRSKKSLRCTLHSLDSQRLRPVNASWCEVWNAMEENCREEVLKIDATALSTTMESYLHKHRFCTECRTKVIKAYNLLLTDEKKNIKEKGYNPVLYQDIKKCGNEKHLHLPTRTEYISELIMRAEPELTGSLSSRRERHAKTLEIAQEEVLTCLGICVYERLHRIHLRLKEEECTCQVFAAIVVDALCRSFEMAVEKKQGISQLELLYEQITKEDQAKEQRKQNKKLKRRKKKERRNEQLSACDNCKTVEPDELDEKLEIEDIICNCDESKIANGNCHCEKCLRKQQQACLTIGRKNDRRSKSKRIANNLNNPIIKQYKTEPDEVELLEKVETDVCCSNQSKMTNDKCHCATCLLIQGTIKSAAKELKRKSKLKVNVKNLNVPIDNIHSLKNSVDIPPPTCKSCHQQVSDIEENNCGDIVKPQPIQNGWSSSEHSQDCGYSSENNNGGCDSVSATSSLISSPYGSEVACSDGFCNHERGDCNPECSQIEIHEEEHSRNIGPGGLMLSLQDMLDDPYDVDDSTSYIPLAEVLAFKSRANILEKREELRKTLRKNFDQLCISKPCIRMRKCE